MTQPELVERSLPPPQGQRERRSFWRRVPRWVLESAVGLLASAAIFSLGRASSLEDKQLMRLEQAVAEAPNQTQVRVMQRLSEIEGSMRELRVALTLEQNDHRRDVSDVRKEMTAIAVKFDKLADAIRDMTVELRTRR